MDITPDAEGVRPIAIYTYDAGGERILKHSNTSVSIYLNGKKVADTIQVDATLYPSGMLVAKLGSNGSEEEQTLAYTKHYFAGTQRVSSKIGTTENLGDFLQDWFTQGTGGPVDVIGSSFGVLENAEQGVVQVYDEFDIEPPVYDSNPVFTPVQSFVHGDDEIEQYFFHPDHLGSTSYITNLLGEVSQHMEYFAFGETFVEEHRSSNNSPYKFNGKELDEETGWYYYGARYYDPRISVWLSVDPLAEQTMTPYQYTYQNPVRYIDPNGRMAVPPDDHFNQYGKFLYRDNKSTNNIVIDFQINPRITYTPPWQSTQLKEYKFDKNNMQTLINIANHYAKEAGVDLSKLRNGSVSVAMWNNKVHEGGRADIKSGEYKIFNGGEYCYTCLMKTNKIEKTISISVDDNKVNYLLNDRNNFVSALQHEGGATVPSHLTVNVNPYDSSHKGQNKEHYEIYNYQINKSTIFKSTTIDFQEQMKKNFEGVKNGGTGNRGN